MMLKELALLSATLFLFAQTNARENPGRLLNCWPTKLKYEKFNINIYSSSRNKRFQLITNGANFSRNDIDYHPGRRTAVIVHGFMSNARDVMILDLVDRLLIWKDMNVLTIDWSDGCSQMLLYHQAAANVEYAGLQIKNFFKMAKRKWVEAGGSLNDWGPLHFIGFSLGAHVVGQAAKFLKEQGNLVVDRVTGLDPAEPCFEDEATPIRLSKNHARFVDVIHTDAARVKNQAFGLWEPIGHADFYVNGGSIQPGCNYRRKRVAEYEYMRNLVNHVLSGGSCNHVRALEIFTDSLIQTKSKICKYWAHPWNLTNNQAQTRRILSKRCDASICPEMGINADLYDYESKNIHTFYVATTSSTPYCERTT